MRISDLASFTTIAAISAGSAFAGSFADAESALRGVYGEYREALFATNSGNAEKSSAAIAAFQEGWSGLAATALAAPQYADDPAIGTTFDVVAEHAAKAAEAVRAGKLPEAHEALEGIRAEIGDLHIRNGIATFSDRMNTYHAVMEDVLAIDPTTLDAAGQERLIELTGVLAYTAAEIEAHPAPEADAEGYAALAESFQASVGAMVAAVRSGDTAAMKAAADGLKVPYSKFFLKFG